MPIHAILDCGITSRVQGFGKRVSLRKYTNSQNVRDQDKSFRGSEDMQEISAASKKLLVILFGGKYGESLDNVRCNNKLCAKI